MRNPEMESLLRERIDDLSTRLLLAEGDAETPPAGGQYADALAELARLAGGAGYERAARLAGELAAAPPPQARLQEDLAQLQQALAEPAAASGALPLAQDPELIADFVMESREHLDAIERNILTLEKEPANAEAIHAVFRGFHTIKGLAGFLEFAAIQELTHEVETALNLAREGKLAITPAVIDAVLESVDALSRTVRAVETGGTCDRSSGHERLLARVRALMTLGPNAAIVPATMAPGEPEAAQAESGPATAAVPESLSVRVDTTKLDYLVDMVGEMVIAQSLVRHNDGLAASGDSRLQRDLAMLSRITGEVQRTAMAMRMVSIGQLFQRTARHVRDLSRKVGKQVTLVTRGEDTELDKTIAEALADPLMHMVRNAIDHGIEEPEARAAAGKAAQASIALAAYHQGGQIVIEIADDGRGLDVAKILAKGRAKGLLRDEAHVSDNDAFRLILEPGFSTAEKVTGLSGRGVGMDVVRKYVEKLRGRIEIRSEAGRGTTFLLKLPLTLAIIDGLVVAVGRQRYIVPLFAVREMFRPAAEVLFTVENRREMVLFRGRLLPVLRLYRRFAVAPRTEDPCQALMIVAETEGQPFCLMVDDLVGKQEVVIKSLGEALGKVPGIAGGAILGDGRVGLILDVGGLWGSHGNG